MAGHLLAPLQPRRLGLAGIFLLLLQVAVLSWSLRPLQRVISELTRVQRGQASRMTELHPRELEPLTESINAFIESERENLDRQRNTLADLAHSLKTPLAVLRTQLDAGAGEAGLRQELDAQLKRMNDLLPSQLARAASPGHTRFAAPAALARAVAASAARSAAVMRTPRSAASSPRPS